MRFNCLLFYFKIGPRFVTAQRNSSSLITSVHLNFSSCFRFLYFLLVIQWQHYVRLSHNMNTNSYLSVKILFNSHHIPTIVYHLISPLSYEACSKYSVFPCSCNEDKHFKLKIFTNDASSSYCWVGEVRIKSSGCSFPRHTQLDNSGVCFYKLKLDDRKHYHFWIQ